MSVLFRKLSLILMTGLVTAIVACSPNNSNTNSANATSSTSHGNNIDTYIGLWEDSQTEGEVVEIYKANGNLFFKQVLISKRRGSGAFKDTKGAKKAPNSTSIPLSIQDGQLVIKTGMGAVPIVMNENSEILLTSALTGSKSPHKKITQERVQALLR